MTFLKLKIKSPLFYRIINIVSLILVIVSLILAFILHGKRKELFEINEKTVSAIRKITIILDSGSGTSYSRMLPANGTKDFQVLTASIKKTEKQALDIIRQRNNMGKALAAISTNLQLPVSFTAKQFQTLKTYQKSADELVQFSEQVNERNDSLINCVVNIAEEIEQPLKDETAFKEANKSLQGYSETLNNLTENIMTVSSELNIAKKQLIKNDKMFKKLEKGIAGGLATSDTSFQEHQSLIAEYEKQLEELQKENADLADSINDQQDNKDFAAQFEKMHPDKKQEYEEKLQEIKSNLYLKLIGKVLKYDKKWGFAIIDLGKFNNVDFIIDGRKETVTVALPLNKEMFVSRNNKFIAKVNVVKVVDKYAVVNLVTPSKEVIQSGDTVFFPIQPE